MKLLKQSVCIVLIHFVEHFSNEIKFFFVDFILQIVGNPNNIYEKNFQCYRCGHRYRTKYTLRRHLKYECGVYPRFQCFVCERKFKQKIHMTYHIKHIHGL